MADQPFSGRLRLRVCALLMEDRKLLLALHHSPTRPAPIWLPPGGEVEFGEPMEAALRREILEESGLEISVGALRIVHEFLEPPFHALEFYFQCERVGGELETGRDPELSADDQILRRLAFIDPADFKTLDIYPEYVKWNSADLFNESAGIRYLKSGVSGF